MRQIRPARGAHERQKWPRLLWIARHGESAGNVARVAALAAGAPIIDIALRDVDVPLSALGERQAIALGEWLGARPPWDRPTIVLASPYLRARRTADLAMQAAGLDARRVPLIVDERLREKEFGILDRLTSTGIAQRYPEQAELRRALGKFYHRPPGGESWCDVLLRLRSVLGTLTREYSGECVLVVCHTVVVLCLRYLLERLNEDEILAIDRAGDVANCAVTAYRYDPARGRHGKLVLEMYNHTAPMREAGAPVTAAPDASKVTT